MWASRYLHPAGYLKYRFVTDADYSPPRWAQSFPVRNQTAPAPAASPGIHALAGPGLIATDVR